MAHAQPKSSRATVSVLLAGDPMAMREIPIALGKICTKQQYYGPTLFDFARSCFERTTPACKTNAGANSFSDISERAVSV